MKTPTYLLSLASITAALLSPVLADDAKPDEIVFRTFEAEPHFLDTGVDYRSDPFAEPTKPPRPKGSPKKLKPGEYPEFFGDDEVFDAIPVFDAAGICRPEDDVLAVFSPHQNVVFVRAPRKIMDLISQFFDRSHGLVARMIEVEGSVVSLRDASVTSEIKAADDPPAFAAKLPVEKGQTLALASVVTRSGQRAWAGRGLSDGNGPSPKAPEPAPISPPPPSGTTANAPATAPAPPPATSADKSDKAQDFFDYNQTGLFVEVEPTLGPDGRTIDLTYVGQFRLPAGDEKHPAALVRGETSTAVTVFDGNAFVQRFRLGDSKNGELVFIIGVRLLEPDGKRVNGRPTEISALEQRWQNLGHQAKKK